MMKRFLVTSIQLSALRTAIIFLSCSYVYGFFYTTPKFDTYTNCIKEREQVNDCAKHQKYRTFDGTCNNLQYTSLGATMTPLHRLARADYYDLFALDTPKGFVGIHPTIPSASQISDRLFKVEQISKASKQHFSVMFMTFGQFLDHDMTLVPKSKDCKNEKCYDFSTWKYPCFPIVGDDSCMEFSRARPACKKHFFQPRQQMNSISAYLDASQVYGSDNNLSKRLRKNDGSGEMKIQNNGLLLIDNSKKNCKIQGGCSLVGEERADENTALYTMHNLWVREHNGIACQLKSLNRHWNDEKVFQETRKIVIGMWQHIVYNEYLPLLIKLPKYQGYDSHADPSIINGFATAAFRYGHSLIPNTFLRLNNNFDEAYKPIPLQNLLRNRLPLNKGGIEPLMFGLLANQSANVDRSFAFGIARKLFVKPGSHKKFNLLALNIQRGRDHGLPTYGVYREICGLPTISSWEHLKKVMLPGATSNFHNLYTDPYNIELFPAGISERPSGNLPIGPTFACIIRKQFEALRAGDRFFYENAGVFTSSQLHQIKKVTLSRILCNNLKNIVSVQRSAFYVANTANRRISCSRISKVSLTPWKEHRKRDFEDHKSNGDELHTDDREVKSLEEFHSDYEQCGDDVDCKGDVERSFVESNNGGNDDEDITNDANTDGMNDVLI